MTINPPCAIRWKNPFQIGIDDLDRLSSGALARMSLSYPEMIATSFHCKELTHPSWRRNRYRGGLMRAGIRQQE